MVLGLSASPIVTLLEGGDLSNVGRSPLLVLHLEPLNDLPLEHVVGRAVLHDLKITLESKIDIGLGCQKRLQQGLAIRRIDAHPAPGGRRPTLGSMAFPRLTFLVGLSRLAGPVSI